MQECNIRYRCVINQGTSHEVEVFARTSKTHVEELMRNIDDYHFPPGSRIIFDRDSFILYAINKEIANAAAKALQVEIPFSNLEKKV